MKLWRATQSLDTTTDRQSAKELQSLASLAEVAILKKGVRTIALCKFVMFLEC